MKDTVFKPRRLLNERIPDGYIESDKDFVLNNIELCVVLLESIEFYGSVAWVWKEKE
jgi:hypothetical protein